MQAQRHFWYSRGRPTWSSKARPVDELCGQRTRVSCTYAALYLFTIILSEMSVPFLGNIFQRDKGFPSVSSPFSNLRRAKCSNLKADLISLERLLPPFPLTWESSWGSVATMARPALLPTLWGCPVNTRWRKKGGDSKGMWPYFAYDPQLSSPNLLRPSVVAAPSAHHFQYLCSVMLDI